MRLKVTPMRAMGGLVALTLVVGGGNLWASYAQVQADKAQQQRAAEAVERKLCTTFAGLSARQPPPGNPKTNPSRAYEQWQHGVLVQLGTDVGCP
jgi:hypothetical protein